MWPLLLSSVGVPDVVGMGESAAKLGDPHIVALYFSMALNLLLVVLLFFSGSSNRKTLQGVSDAARISAEADLAAATMGKDEWAQIQAQLALAARDSADVRAILKCLPDEVGDAVWRAMEKRQ